LPIHKNDHCRQHEFASGLNLKIFGIIRKPNHTENSEELVFECGATGYFELLVNGKPGSMYNNWRTLPSRVPFNVEAGKKYKIEIRYAQLTTASPILNSIL